MNAILVIKDIPDENKDYILKATFTLWKIQKEGLREIGISGSQFLQPMPRKRELPKLYEDNYELKAEIKGWNDCIAEMWGEE